MWSTLACRRGRGGGHISINTSWASGVSHPGHLNKAGTKCCKSVSNIFIVSCMLRFDNSDTDLDWPTSPPSGAARTSAPLASRENDNKFSVSCQVGGWYHIRFFLLIRNLYLVGVWFSEDERTRECGLCTKMTFFKNVWNNQCLHDCMTYITLKLFFELLLSFH